MLRTSTEDESSEASNDIRGLIGFKAPTEERNPRTTDIDTLPALDIVTLIGDEDTAVLAAVEQARPAVAALVEAAVTAIKAGGRVHYFGAGTSGRIGVLDAVELLPTYGVGAEWFEAHLAGGVAAMVKAAEGAEDDVELGRSDADAVTVNDVVIGIAASGRTPYVSGAFAVASERGAFSALISSNPHAELAAKADHVILLDTGAEVITGSTRMKAASAQKMALNTFSTATMVLLGKTYSNLMIDLRPTNAKLHARVIRLLMQATGLDDLVCERALVTAEGDIKVAILALLSNPGADATAPDAFVRARAILVESDGIVRRALERLADEQ